MGNYKQNKGESYLTHKNIKIILVPPVLVYQGGLPPSIKNNFQYLVNATKMGLKIIKENDIDIIHSNNFTPALNIASCKDEKPPFGSERGTGPLRHGSTAQFGDGCRSK